ncbi:MAG: citrate transporter [Lachnospiraceae bacterium]
MLETAVVLTPIHYCYLIGVLVILGVMILRKDTPAVCIAFLFLLGFVGLGTIRGGIQTVFNAILYAGREFMEIIATIALVTALSKCLSELGSDYLLMRPMSRIMKTPSLTWWILGIVMFIFSLFLWPSPSVALVGAIMLPFAIRSGLTPLAAAMAMNLFGHGIALSYDLVIQGAPAVSASAAGISASQILTEGRPVFWVMGLTTVLTAFFLNRKNMKNSLKPQDFSALSVPARHSLPAKILAFAVPIAFLADIFIMLTFDLRGGDATSLVSGTAILLMCLGSVLAFRKDSLEKITGYLTDGFLFAIRIFAPVIAIGAFFFLGGEGISSIMGESFSGGILNDWAVWLAKRAPLNPSLIAGIQMIAGALTGLDGSGFSGLPLTGALAHTFGNAVGASVPILAALGQITAIFVGGGTIVPWGLIPVAAICNVSPLELARKNLVPVLIGFFCTFLTACFLL